jgi:DNA replication protein DnaC
MTAWQALAMPNTQCEGREKVMTLKQVDATKEPAAAAEGIAANFREMGLPRLANAELYLGIPFTILENFHQALCRQRSEDEKKKFLNRLRYAGISKDRSADTFKWDDNAYPLAEPGAIESALGIEFVRQRKSLIVAGPAGTGKSLLVTILACKAIWAGFSVMYKTAHDIATELQEARSLNSLSGYIKKLQARDVLVMEDVTFATFDKQAAQDFFSVMDKRYGRKTTVITANGNINEWAGNFPDKSMSSAILGRFYEDALLINTNGAVDMRLSKAKDFLAGMNNDSGSGAGGGR